MSVKKSRDHFTNKQDEFLCEKMSFAVAEEYKMLRTKIELIIPSERSEDTAEDRYYSCRIIGVTSSLRGEGKSTTAINISYTFAEAGYKVCLLEADMRLPCISKRLNLKETPGLSNILTGKQGIYNVRQCYKTEKGTRFDVITAGDIPPLPSEMLSSSKMKMILNALSESYDYVIVDLPPVNIVTDALALSTLKMLEGMLFVVREKYCSKKALSHALEQFKVANTRILGIVYTCAGSPMGGSNYYRYYRKK